MSNKKETVIDILEKKYFKTGMLYKTDFQEAKKNECKCHLRKDKLHTMHIQ